MCSTPNGHFQYSERVKEREKKSRVSEFRINTVLETISKKAFELSIPSTKKSLSGNSTNYSLIAIASLKRKKKGRKKEG